MRYTLDVFEQFLKTVDLESYRERFTHIKTVEMDLPPKIQALDTIYEIYWDKSKNGATNPPSFDEYYDYYYTKNEAEINNFWDTTGFGKECDCFKRGLKARIYRTWASLITQIHAGYVAETVFGKDTVEQSTVLDHNGIDILVKYKNNDIKIQVKKDSKRPEISRMHGAEKNENGYFYIWYVLVQPSDYANPYYVKKPREGQLRDSVKAFVKYNKENGTLDRFDNGFVVFTTKEFELIKQEFDK
ncbi:MAG: TaqI family restriction endonuclease [Clostridia bacterium]|nr:TaqI family restriction endonuclease [Clostridia bacterium]